MLSVEGKHREVATASLPFSCCCSGSPATLLLLLLLLLLLSGLLHALPHGAIAAVVMHAEAAWETDPTTVALATIALYVLWLLCFIPTTIPELLMGFVFGFRAGYCIDIVGKLIGAVLSYALGRTLLRPCVRRMLGATGSELLSIFEEEAETRPFMTALIIRAAYVPMPLKNYGLALLGIQATPYLVTLIPLEIIDTYTPIAIGASASDLAALLHGDLPPGEDAAHARARLAWLGITALATAGLLVYVSLVTGRLIEERRSGRAAARAAAAA
jgi:uncharacterized membrane protein YdjX (TVP38/TMEM64 family)